MRLVLALLLWLASLPAFAQANQQADAAPLQFRDTSEEARFHALAAELRCVMCQNQSLADSHAPLAVDLKNQVREQVRAGRADAEVIDFMTQRYGDFVLYKPPWKAKTALLWAGPALLVLLGTLLAWRTLARARSNDVSATPVLGAACEEAPPDWR